MSMKPGVTVRPLASMVRPAGSRERSPTAVMASPVTPTSPRRAGAPVPSMSCPPVILRSSTGAGLVTPVVQIQQRERAGDVRDGDWGGRMEIRGVEHVEAVHPEQAHGEEDLVLQQLEHPDEASFSSPGEAEAGQAVHTPHMPP